MFEIRRYTADDRKSWDGYVRRARNATFLFERNYMEYHADRFDDWSLMFYRQGRLYALLPAHRRDTTLISHYGLTYGGLIMDIHVTISDTCQLFACLNDYLRHEGFTRVLYRPIPWIIMFIPPRKTSMPSSGNVMPGSPSATSAPPSACPSICAGAKTICGGCEKPTRTA